MTTRRSARTDEELCAVAQTPGLSLAGDALDVRRQEAEAELIDRHRTMWRSEARDFNAPLTPREDREMEAQIAVLKAARSFDPVKGVPFAPYAKHCVRNRLSDVFRASERRLDATGGPVLSLDPASGEEGEGGGILDALAAENPDPGASLDTERTLAAVRDRMLSRYVDATGDKPVHPVAHAAVRAFALDLAARGEVPKGEALALIAAVRQESSQMILLGIGATAEWDDAQRALLARLAGVQVALATSLAAGLDLDEAAEAEGLSPMVARRLLAGLQRAIRPVLGEAAIAA